MPAGGCATAAVCAASCPQYMARHAASSWVNNIHRRRSGAEKVRVFIVLNTLAGWRRSHLVGPTPYRPLLCDPFNNLTSQDSFQAGILQEAQERSVALQYNGRRDQG